MANFNLKAKVAAYITCYNDEVSAKNCIQAIKTQSYQVLSIFIIDNSWTELSINKNNDDFLHINHYPNNIGVAQGLGIGLRWAIDQGYDFLWTFDQDSIPAQNCLEILLHTYSDLSQCKSYQIGIIAPTPTDLITNRVIEGTMFVNDHFVAVKHNKDVSFYECDSPITSGSLISLDAAKTVELPRSELFIDGIDFDYGMRIKQKGFRNLIVPQAILQHNFGNPIKIRFLDQERYIQQYSALRHYYICRNHTYLETRYAKGIYRLTSLIRRIKYMVKTILMVLLYDNEDKKFKIWLCLLGTYHGLKGHLGKF